MIYLITGEDTYKQRQAVNSIIAASTVPAETVDGSECTENQLADIIAGATLFSTERLVVLYNTSENPAVWGRLGDWVDRVSSDTTLVLVEAKPDKRTKAYKIISKVATLRAADPWTERHVNTARAWVVQRAAELGASLDNRQADELVARATGQGARPGSISINQQQLENALQSLAVLDTITDDAIAAVLPESSVNNIFTLIGVALGGNRARVQELLRQLHVTADPYMALGYLASQWSQLAAIKVSGEKRPEVIAGQLGVTPYAVKNLQPMADALSYERVRALTLLLAALDSKAKSTGGDPWAIVDRFVGELATKKITE